MDYMQAIFSWVNAPLFATMLLGMFIWWITPNGAFWGLTVGMLTSFFLWMGVKFQWFSESIITMSSVHSDQAANFWRAWWAWLICFGVTILVSVFTKPRAKEELVGLVKSLTPIEKQEPLPFYKRPVAMAIWAAIIQPRRLPYTRVSNGKGSRSMTGAQKNLIE